MILRNFEGVKTPNVLNLLVFSDSHNGHRNTPTAETLEFLEEQTSLAKLQLLDAVLIPGDFFDKLLTLPEDNVGQIQGWIGRFLQRCKAQNVLVRVLEGTGTHDAKQPAIFVIINESTGINADVKYFDEIAVEYVESLGLWFLYVPDERGDGDTVWQMVNKKLQEAGRKTVDIALMHGVFEFQMPSHQQSPATHNLARYESIVELNIFIGHHHTHRVFGKAVVPGSTNRLKQGEEEPKGIVQAIYRGNGQNQLLFIENTKARLYKAVDCKGLDLEAVIRKLDALGGLPVNSALSIKGYRGSGLKEALPTLRMRYPDYQIDLDLTKDESGVEERLEDVEFHYEPISITPDNLPGLMTPRLAKREIPTQVSERALVLLQALCGAK